MKRRLFYSIPLFCFAQLGEAASEKEPEARKAAELWLVALDAGDYLLSWQQAGEIFQRGVTSETWAHLAKDTRGRLGQVKARTFKSDTVASVLPGAPPGQYTITQFNTSFATKASAVETITTVRLQDGTWKVVGYFVR